MKIIPFNTKPSIDDSVFIAQNSLVIGNVTIKQDSSIWFGSVIRGDMHYIKIGKKTNVQDNCTIHVTTDVSPTIIGDEVTILVNNKGNIHKTPILSFKGLPILDSAEFAYGLNEEIYNISKSFSLNNNKQKENIKDAIKIGCRKYAKEKTGKKPFTNINIVKI